MKLVIDIPEETYIATCQGRLLPPDVTNIVEAIKSATIIDKKHGRIIDESRIEKIYYHIESSENERFHIEHVVIDGTDAPTIIEREENNETNN